MKTELTVDEIIALINQRQSEAQALHRTFKRLGKRKMAAWYEGEVMACSTLLFRITQASK